jgi:potassium intermediate/small conductance calcium-activated channel subfamily N protein 2
MIDISGLENREALLREVEERAYQDLLDETAPDQDNSRILDQKRKNEALEMKRIQQDRKRQKVLRIRRTMKLNDSVGFVLALFGVFVAFNENEDNNNHDNKSTSSGMSMRVLVLISTIFLVMTSVRHHYLQYLTSRELQTYSSKVGNKFYKSIHFLYMLLEVCIVGVHSPPGYDKELEFDQLNGKLTISVDVILTSLTLMRAFLIPRIVWHYSKMSGERATAVCGEHGCEADILFVFRALFKEKPFLMLSFGMFISIFVFALGVRVYERPYQRDLGSSQDYNYVWNSMWLVVLTMTTVGYGDFFPTTHLGRLIIIISCFWGVFLVSMMVVTLNDSSKFSPGEKRSFDLLSRLKAKKRASRAAANLVLLSLRYNIFKQKNRRAQDYEELRLVKYGEIMHSLQMFRGFREKWQTIDYTDEEKLRQLSEQIMLDLDGLKQQVGGLSSVDVELKKIEEHLEASAKSTKVALMHLDELEVQLDKVEVAESI